MKRFILKLLLFLSIPLCFLYVLSYIVDTGLKKSKYFYYSEWNDLFNGRINADLLVLGNSRAWVHFSPQILDSMLNLNSYNLGLDGACLNAQLVRFKLYLLYNNKPKYIIQEIGATGSLINGTLPHLQQLYPYLDNSEIWKIVKSSDPSFGVLERYFPLYKYNNELTLIKEGILSNFGKGVKPTKYKGYEGRKILWDNGFESFVKLYPKGTISKIDSSQFSVLMDYIDFCKKNDIKIIFVTSPTYKEYIPYVLNYTQVIDTITNIANANNIPYLDYTKDTLCNSKEYFYNTNHLNYIGSRLFSIKFANDIKKYIN